MEILNFQKVARIISKTWVNKLFILSNKVIIILFIIIDGIFSKKARTEAKYATILIISSYTIEFVIIYWWNIYGSINFYIL
jgi:hypothetical protein